MHAAPGPSAAVSHVLVCVLFGVGRPRGWACGRLICWTDLSADASAQADVGGHCQACGGGRDTRCSGGRGGPLQHHPGGAAGAVGRAGLGQVSWGGLDGLACAPSIPWRICDTFTHLPTAPPWRRGKIPSSNAGWHCRCCASFGWPPKGTCVEVAACLING